MNCLKYIYTYGLIVILFIGVSACESTTKTYETVNVSGGYSPPVSIANLLASTDLQDSNVGYQLIDIETRQTVASLNVNQPFLPASTVKLLTGYAALEILGPDHRFHTKLCTIGQDLYLIGGGDPSLDMDAIMQMAKTVAKYGRQYDNFYYDDSLYPRINYVEEKQPQDAYYNPTVSSLSIKDALLYMNWQPSDLEGEISLSQAPNASISQTNIPTDWLLELKEGSRGHARFPVNNPSLYTAKLFHQFLNWHSVKVSQPMPKTVLRAGCETSVTSHQSAPLKTLVAEMFETSSNLQAELIGLAVSAKLGQAPNTLKQSAHIMMNWYQRSFTNIDWQGFYLYNHSGLSAETVVTPAQLAMLLSDIGKNGDVVEGVLPVSGWKGWLKKRLYTPDASLRVWAKTGAINYGIGLSGYLYAKSGKRYAFSIFVNDLDARANYDALDDAARFDIGPIASKWNRQSKQVIDEIIRYWIHSN